MDPRCPEKLNVLSLFASLLVVLASELAERVRERERESELGPKNTLLFVIKLMRLAPVHFL